jgi:hypothetical protein
MIFSMPSLPATVTFAMDNAETNGIVRIKNIIKIAHCLTKN